MIGRAFTSWYLPLPFLVALVCGCHSSSGIDPRTGLPLEMTKHGKQLTRPYDGALPHELEMVSLPEYVIEPPDILRIDALRVVPPSPYRVEPLDGLYVQAADIPDTDPINGVFTVEPDGVLNLGPRFGGPVRVSGLYLNQVAETIEKHLREKASLPRARVSVSLGQSRALQQIRGEHLVRPDGTVGLGTYGSVRVVGLTLTGAKAAIEQHLGKYLQAPEIAVDVAAYNSKTFYVIYDGGGLGQQVVQLPITGNDTVLRAISQLNGLSPISSKHNIWIARPSPVGAGVQLILPVDWVGITTKGKTDTNYQLMPGDRLYVKANPFVAANNILSTFLSPFERLLGFSLLGNSTIRALDGQNGGN